MAELVINCGAVRHNIEVLKSKTKAKMCVMVKADAYGHGFEVVPKISDMADVFGVARNEEALELVVDRGIKNPVVVAGAFSEDCLEECICSNIQVAVYSLGMISEIDKIARKNNLSASVHLKIDTGMHRLGVMPENVPEYLSYIEGCKNLTLSGVFTHFATSDDDVEFLDYQNNLFENCTKHCKTVKHAANSAATIRGEKYHYDMVRCGIAVYGYMPYAGMCNSLVSAMSLRAKISEIKAIRKGDTVGYSRNFTAKNDMVIAVVSIGYADGVPRLLSNCGKVLVNGESCGIIGNVCMDLLTVDVTDFIGSISIGDYAYIISPENDAASIAKAVHTIPYEIITGITSRPKRIYI